MYMYCAKGLLQNYFKFLSLFSHCPVQLAYQVAHKAVEILRQLDLAEYYEETEEEEKIGDGDSGKEKSDICMCFLLLSF